MNKRGFTLIELLAVIIIIALLALLTSVSVTKMVRDAKNDLSNIQIASIKAAAESWGADNLDLLPESGKCGYLTLEDLKLYGLLDSTIIDPKTSSEMADSLKIKICSSLNAYGNIETTYEVNATNLTNVPAIYGPVCTFANDGTRGKVGAKYTCKLDKDRTFYILDTSVSNKVTLIMDEDYGDETYSWCKDMYSTSNSCSHDGLDETIEQIQNAFGKNVVVGLPSYDQIYNVNNSINVKNWLYDNLDLIGYWTISPSSTNKAYAVYGNINAHGDIYYQLYAYSLGSNYAHIRPTITLPLSRIK